jgi:hypothetical protein
MPPVPSWVIDDQAKSGRLFVSYEFCAGMFVALASFDPAMRFGSNSFITMAWLRALVL